MRPMQFHVRCEARESRWVVMLGNSLYRGNSVYGTYLDKEQAVLDAVDAARDAVQAGCEAQVWIKDRSTTARVSSPVANLNCVGGWGVPLTTGSVMPSVRRDPTEKGQTRQSGIDFRQLFTASGRSDA